VDSLCLTTLYGFSALELTAAGPCRPCDVERDGLSIGEAAGFALIERVDLAGSAGGGGCCSAMARAAMGTICPIRTRKGSAP
jgi:hypothetical protein